jgi:hypothetical protein
LLRHQRRYAGDDGTDSQDGFQFVHVVHDFFDEWGVVEMKGLQCPQGFQE